MPDICLSYGEFGLDVELVTPSAILAWPRFWTFALPRYETANWSRQEQEKAIRAFCAHEGLTTEGPGS